MDSRACGICNIEKRINVFHKIYRRCKLCISRRWLKPCNDNKDKISTQHRYILKTISMKFYNNKTFDKYLLKTYLDQFLDKKIN